MREDSIPLAKNPSIKNEIIEYWESKFEEYKSSGLSQAAYCRQNDIKYCVFLYWKRKLFKPRRSSSSDELKLVEVALKGKLKRLNGNGNGNSHSLSLNSRSNIRVWIGGMCIEVGEDFSPVLLSQIVEVLREL